MSKIFRIVTIYPASCLCIAIIWVLCFCTPPHTPLDNVPLMDKWTHILMYAGTCSVIWVEHLRYRKRNIRLSFPIIWAWLAPILMSGAIELLQAYCTGGRRSGDWLDFLANAIGATVGFLFGLFVYRAKYKD